MLRDCVLPYDEKAKHVQYWTICPSCIAVLENDPQPFISLERDPTHVVAPEIYGKTARAIAPRPRRPRA